jgi:hypothetical protein
MVGYQWYQAPTVSHLHTTIPGQPTPSNNATPHLIKNQGHTLTPPSSQAQPHNNKSIFSAGGSFEAVKLAGAARTLDIPGSDPMYHPPERWLLGL